MAKTKSTFGKTATGRQPNLAGVTKATNTSQASKPVSNPNAVHFGGYWPDGTIKVVMPDGTVLPQGTQVKVTGQGTTIIRPDGTPVQFIGGGTGRPVFNAVTDATTLPGVDPNIAYESGRANRQILSEHDVYDTNWKGLLTDPVTGQVVRPGDLTAKNPDGSYQYGRGVQDYFTNLDRSNHDYGTATGDLQHSYDIQGNNQLQAINQAGELGGGALAQALAKRTANQAHDQSGLDTSHSRGLADLLSNTTRSGTDAYKTLQADVGENSIYQAAVQQEAGTMAGPGLVDNPNYEVVGNNIYTRMPDGSLKATGKTTTGTSSAPKPAPARVPRSQANPHGYDPLLRDPFGKKHQVFAAASRQPKPPHGLGY